LPARVGGAQPLREIGHFGSALRGQLDQLGGHQRQEAVAQVAHDVVGERARVAPLLHRQRHDRERAARVVLDERLDELVERRGLQRLATTAGHQLERGHGVARGAATLAQHGLQRVVGEVDACIAGQPADVVIP
jgi:hypothetical protein